MPYENLTPNEMLCIHNDFSSSIRRSYSKIKNRQSRLDLQKLIKNYNDSWFSYWDYASRKNINRSQYINNLKKYAESYYEAKSTLEQWLLIARLEG
jgi:hypothetical protein